MIFTLYYMYATILQWWRLGALKNKISGTLNSHNSLLIGTSGVIYDNRKQRSIENLLFHNEDRIGCTVVPKQKINLTQWISFPKDLRCFPIYFTRFRQKIEPPQIYILIQAFLDSYTKHQSNIIEVENFGELVAWRITDNFEAIVRTDFDKLTKLVHCFSQNDIDINHELKLLAVETIEIEGSATRIRCDKIFSTDFTLKYSYDHKHWKTFVGEVKQLYSKLKESTNPKIKIENGSTKPEDPSKKPLVSEVKPIKKEPKTKSEDKNTLEVTSSDFRRHKSKDKTEKHKTEKEKESKKEPPKPKAKPEKVETQSKPPIPKTEVTKDKVKSSAPSTSSASKTELKVKPEPKPREKLSDKHKQKAVEKTVVKTEAFKANGSVVDLTGGKDVKPPNLLVYADSLVAKENVKTVLQAMVNRNKYTVYDLPTNPNLPVWDNSTVLVVICGTVPENLTSHLLQYLLNGGQLLCLCSDFLYSVLHTFTTAEVREHELVRFSYGQWKQVQMMHHIFCYQASPAKKQFSKDSDHSNQSSGNGSSPIAPRTPSIVELQHNGKDYIIQVQILGTEETWQTPSLLLATVKGHSGRAIFSQVHLEINPVQYEDDESKFEALKKSDGARLEILKDILMNHLDIDCSTDKAIAYTTAYFLGRHDLKLKMFAECESIVNSKLICDKITVQFYGKDEKPEQASSSFLPVLIHACPKNFCTFTYFEYLDTEHIGRLVIYSEVLSSSQLILNKTLAHGIVVIPSQQTNGAGRSNNVWISPLGSAMFSLQLHIPLQTPLGNALSLIQQLVMVGIVHAIKSIKGCENLNIGIKWPNDLYADKSVKIGGLIVNSTVNNTMAIVNIGCGINLDNSTPTTCINELITVLNNKNKSLIPQITFETYFALVFNQIEKLLKSVQENNLEEFYELYYKYWLHKEATVTVCSSEGNSKKAQIVGIDQFGFLRVRSDDGIESTVQPDGNSFNMMKGLIAPKLF